MDSSRTEAKIEVFWLLLKLSIGVAKATNVTLKLTFGVAKATNATLKLTFRVAKATNATIAV
ncbi:MAG: hypothetical protein ACYTXY_11550 [Nostoc sp.]